MNLIRSLRNQSQVCGYLMYITVSSLVQRVESVRQSLSFCALKSINVSYFPCIFRIYRHLLTDKTVLNPENWAKVVSDVIIIYWIPQDMTMAMTLDCEDEKKG
jgi:hypothetical protein